MPRVVNSLFLWIIVLFLFVGICYAEPLTVYGPTLLEVDKGKPYTLETMFSSPVVGSNFTLRIGNGGGDTKYKISSGLVILNGEKITPPSSFNQKTTTITKRVSIKTTNKLSITISGKPGTYITIQIDSDSETPVSKPAVSFSANPQTILSGESSTLSWETSLADSATIDSGIGVVALDGTTDVNPMKTTTYTLTATGQGGTATASTTVAVNQLEPTASISANPTTITSGESSTLTWSCTNSYRCEIDNGIGTVANNGSMSVTPSADSVYTVTATGTGGMAKGRASITVKEPGFTGVKIDQPVDRASTQKLSTMVSGQFSFPPEGEVGVIVNGHPASVAGNTFMVNSISLVEGWNTITAVATDTLGNQFNQSVQIFNQYPLDYVALQTYQDSGLIPLKVEFNISGSLSSGATSESLVCQGPSTPSISKTNSTEYIASIDVAGVYSCTLNVTDSQGNTLSDSLAIHALSKDEINALLQPKWAGLKSALSNGNVEAALEFIVDSSKNHFRLQFTDLYSSLTQITNEMGDATLLEVGNGMATYDTRIIRNGAPYLFQLKFVKNGQGIWQIKSF